MRGIQLQLILTAYFVNSGWTMVQLHDSITDQTVASNMDDDAGRISENNFNKMKEELWTVQDRNAIRRGMYDRSNAERTSRNTMKKRSLADYVNVTVDLTYRDEKNRTYMHLAAEAENFTFVDYLIYHGADLNATDEDGRTPLHVAASKGHLSVCIQLVSSGANLLARDKLGRTPLHSGVIGGDSGVLNYLLQSGAEVELTDNDGKTAIQLTTDPYLVRYLQGEMERRLFHKVQDRNRKLMGKRVKEVIEEEKKGNYTRLA